MFTMFKEQIQNETDMKKWPWSMRRTLAFGCFLAFILFGVLGIIYFNTGNWFLFIPCGLAFIGIILLLFFTTLQDLKESALKIAEFFKKKG